MMHQTDRTPERFLSRTQDSSVLTAMMVHQILPHMTESEAMDRMKDGTIASGDFRFWIQRSRAAHLARRQTQSPQILRLLSSKSPENIYFSDIHDLKDKIFKGEIDGRLSRRQGTMNETEERIPGLDKLLRSTSGPRSHPGINRPPQPAKERTLSRCEPPLLPVIYQNTEPTFFAGVKKPYRLPEQLPELR